MSDGNPNNDLREEDLKKLIAHYETVLSDSIQEGKQTTSPYIEDLINKIEDCKSKL